MIDRGRSRGWRASGGRGIGPSWTLVLSLSLFAGSGCVPPGRSEGGPSPEGLQEGALLSTSAAHRLSESQSPRDKRPAQVSYRIVTDSTVAAALTPVSGKTADHRPTGEGFLTERKRVPADHREFPDTSDQRLPLPHFSARTADGGVITPRGIYVPPLPGESLGTAEQSPRPSGAAPKVGVEPPAARLSDREQTVEGNGASNHLREHKSPVSETDSAPGPAAPDKRSLPEGTTSASVDSADARAQLSLPPAREISRGIDRVATLTGTPVQPRQVFVVILALLVILLIACSLLLRTAKHDERRLLRPHDRRNG